MRGDVGGSPRGSPPYRPAGRSERPSNPSLYLDSPPQHLPDIPFLPEKQDSTEPSLLTHLLSLSALACNMGVLGLTGGPPGLVCTAWLMGALRITSTEITPEAAGVLPVKRPPPQLCPGWTRRGRGAWV